LDANGADVPGANVRLVSLVPPYQVYRAGTTDRGGQFSFTRVALGGARVVADRGADGVVTSAALEVTPGSTLEITLVLSPAGAVNGTVVDTQGHPIVGASLSVVGIPWAISATSDAAGAFRLFAVPDEATAIVAAARGYDSAETALGARTPDVELNLRIVMAEGGPIEGDVADDQGNPVAAHVVACEGSPSAVRGESGADGTFRLAPSATGCEVVAEHPDYSPSDVATAVQGQRLSLRLKTGGAIDGVVVNERGTALTPFAVGVEGIVLGRGQGMDRPGLRSFDDPTGAFHLDKLPPGTYVLTATVPGRPPARSEPIDVHAASVTSGVRIVLPPGGVIVGTVYDTNHVPLAGADLHFDAVSRLTDSKATAQTDGAGQFRLEEAPAGPITIRVHKDGYRLKLVSGIHVASGATLRTDILMTVSDGGAGMELSGIGAGLGRSAEGIIFQSVYDNDPAARAGLHEGDRVVRIDGEPTDGMSLPDALQRIRGAAGTSVGISVVRPGTDKTLDLTIVRGDVAH
jgi:hypothetical protein